jgi:hypothetical protein
MDDWNTVRFLAKEVSDPVGRSRWGRGREVGSETAIHRSVSAALW